MLFAFPAAIAVAIIAGILLGGPVAGFLVAAVIGLVIVAFAVGLKPRVRLAAARWFVVPLVIAAAGIVVIAVSDGAGEVIGWGIVAVAVTVAISLVFLEVGRSEDRARAREERLG